MLGAKLHATCARQPRDVPWRSEDACSAVTAARGDSVTGARPCHAADAAGVTPAARGNSRAKHSAPNGAVHRLQSPAATKETTMQKKTSIKSLKLRAEIVRALTTAAMARVAGGYPQSVNIVQCFNTKDCPDTKLKCPMDTVQQTCTISNIVC